MSLVQLRQFPVDALTIDRPLIRDMRMDKTASDDGTDHDDGAQDEISNHRQRDRDGTATRVPDGIRTANMGGGITLATDAALVYMRTRSRELGPAGPERSSPILDTSKTNTKSNGQECPFHAYLVPLPGETTRPYSVARLRRSNMRQVSSETLLIASSPSRSLRR